MRFNIGSVDLKEDTARWIKVMSTLEGSSQRVFIGDLINKTIDKRKAKWLLDLEIAASAANMTVVELWEYILEKGEVPESSNTGASLKTFIDQVERGDSWKEKTD